MGISQIGSKIISASQSFNDRVKNADVFGGIRNKLDKIQTAHANRKLRSATKNLIAAAESPKVTKNSKDIADIDTHKASAQSLYQKKHADLEPKPLPEKIKIRSNFLNASPQNLANTLHTLKEHYGSNPEKPFPHEISKRGLEFLNKAFDQDFGNHQGIRDTIFKGNEGKATLKVIRNQLNGNAEPEVVESTEDSSSSSSSSRSAASTTSSSRSGGEREVQANRKRSKKHSKKPKKSRSSSQSTATSVAGSASVSVSVAPTPAEMDRAKNEKNLRKQLLQGRTHETAAASEANSSEAEPQVFITHPNGTLFQNPAEADEKRAVEANLAKVHEELKKRRSVAAPTADIATEAKSSVAEDKGLLLKALTKAGNEAVNIASQMLNIALQMVGLNHTTAAPLPTTLPAAEAGSAATFRPILPDQFDAAHENGLSIGNPTIVSVPTDASQQVRNDAPVVPDPKAGNDAPEKDEAGKDVSAEMATTTQDGFAAAVSIVGLFLAKGFVQFSESLGTVAEHAKEYIKTKEKA